MNSTPVPTLWKLVSESMPPLAGTALALSVHEWTNLGMDEDDSESAPTSDMHVLVDRITALLLIRCVAIQAQPGEYTDYSTTTICRTALMQQQPWPMPITDDVIQQLRHYVHSILSQYNRVPYHNYEHAYHVVLSVNKLVDMMIQSRSKTFGLRHDPLLLFGMLFAALVHDVEHLGIPNRQLTAENDPLALLYNDQSIAENRSLYLAFKELLSGQYDDLRRVIFGEGGPVATAPSYHRFRSAVVGLILTTDIASPERTQLVKSKWKEAFGEQQQLRRTSENKRTPSRRNLTVAAASPGDGDESMGESFVSNDDDYDDDYDSDEMDGVVVSGKTMSSSNYSNTTASSGGGGGGDHTTGLPTSHTTTSASTVMDDDDNNNNNNDDDDDKYDDDDDDDDDDDNSGAPPVNGRGGRGGGGGGGRRRMSSSGDGGVLRGGVKFQRRTRVFSMPAPRSEAVDVPPRRSSSVAHGATTALRRKRLGIRRSIDLSGESLEIYRRVVAAAPDAGMESDSPDPLKASVVMETIMSAADVAHNLQGWDSMVKWSTKLYLELKRASLAQRADHDPAEKWCENQIGFLEFYLLPLAQRLEDTGVFGPRFGKVFADNVLNNRDRWLMDGPQVTEQTIEAGEAMARQVEYEASLVSKEEHIIEMEHNIWDSPPEPGDPNYYADTTEEQDDELIVEEETDDVEPVKNIITTNEDKKKRRSSWLARLIVLLTVAVMLFHWYLSSPVRPGRTIPPGVWLSKCGLLAFVRSCENYYLRVDRDGSATLLTAGREALWKIQGAVCATDDDSCVPGMQFLEDKSLVIGGMKASVVEMYREFDFAPWPFEDQPVLPEVRWI